MVFCDISLFWCTQLKCGVLNEVTTSKLAKEIPATPVRELHKIIRYDPILMI